MQSVMKQSHAPMTVKDLSVLLWSIARLGNTNEALPTLLNKKAEVLLNETALNTFEIEFESVRSQGVLTNPEEEGEEMEMEEDEVEEENEIISSSLLADLERIGDSDTEVQPVMRENTLNIQAIGMIYWSLAQVLRNPRQQFHKYSELFVSKHLDKMIAENKVPEGNDPIDVIDQFLKTGANMIHQQASHQGLNINKQTLKFLAKVVRTRKQMSMVLNQDGESIKLKLGRQSDFSH